MLARKSIFQFFTQIVSSAINLFALSLIGHYMGPTPLGILSYASSFVNVFAFIGDMGIGTAHIKKISEGKPVDKCMKIYFLTRVVLLFLMLITVSSMMIWKIYFGDGFDTKTHVVVILFSMLNMILCVYPEVISVTMSAQVKTAIQNIPGILGTLAYGIATAVAVFFFRQWGAIALTIAILIRVIVRNSAILYLCRNSIKKLGEFDWALFREYVFFCMPIILSSAAISIAQNIDKILIEEFWNSSQVGIYYGMQRIQEMILLVSGTILALLLPTFSKLHASNNIPAIRRVLYQSEKFLSFIILPALLIIASFPRIVIKIILGPEFISGEKILYCFLVTALLYTINRPSASCMVGIGRVKIDSLCNVINTLMLIALNLILIPDHLWGYKMLNMGAYGAALAVMISSITGIMLTKSMVYRCTGIQPYWLTIPRAALAAVIFFLLRQTPYYNSNSFLIIISASFIMAISYYIFLFLFRLLHKDDISYLIDQLNLKKIIAYVRSEVETEEQSSAD